MACIDDITFILNAQDVPINQINLTRVKLISMKIFYFATMLFVPKVIILVQNNNLQLKNVGHKVVPVCLPRNVFYDHLLNLS